MSPRLFRHTASRKFHIAKVALATLTITAIFLGNVGQVFAEDYSAFLKLFNTPVTPPTTAAAGTPSTSGIGGVHAEAYNSSGVSVFNIGTWTVMDPKINSDGGTPPKSIDYYYHLVGGQLVRPAYKDSFLVRIGYLDKTTNQMKYAYAPISSVKQSPSVRNGELVQVGFYADKDHFGLSQATTGIAAGGVIGIVNPAIGIYTELSSFSGWLFGDDSVIMITHEEVRATATFDTPVPYNTPMSADFWYCAGSSNLITGGLAQDGTTAQDSDSPDGRIAHFPGYCGGTAYFKIGDTYTGYTTPTSAVQAAVEDQKTYDQAIQGSQDQSDHLPKCAVISDNGSLVGCIAVGFYYLIFKPLAWVAGLIGKIFDFFIGYSLSDASYRFGFAVRGWQLVRDICNIFFILILVWTGFAAVFGISKFSMKQIVPALIINAILINFSLFAVRVVIDFSNVAARVFYSRMYVCEGPCIRNDAGEVTNYNRGAFGYWPLSEKIVSAFNPQKIIAGSVLGQDCSSNPTTQTGDGSIDTQKSEVQAQLAAKACRTTAQYAGYFILLCLIAVIIMFFIAKMFWGVAFMFLGRVIGLYVCMIFAPFAFLSRKIPFLEKIEDLSWGKWSNNLSNYALLAPLFVFYLYIVYSFLSIDFFSAIGFQKTDSFLSTVLSIIIPMLIIYKLIDYGKDLAKKYAGDAGNMVQGWLQKVAGTVTGTAVGLASGGTAFLGRNVAGRGLRVLGNTGKRTDAEGKTTTRAERWAANANNSWMGRQWNNIYSKTQTGSWDARNTKLGGLAGKASDFAGEQLGTKFTDKISGSIYGLGKKSGEGGVVAINKKLAEEKQKIFEKRIEMSHLSDDEAKNAATFYKNKRAERYAETHWEDDENIDSDPRVKEDAARHSTLKKEEVRLKDEIEKLNKDIARQQSENNIAGVGGVNSLTQTRDAREQELEQNRTNQTTTLAALTQARTDAISAIRQNGGAAYRNTTAYEAAKKIEEKRLSEYKVKDAVSFGNMMRAEYINDLQNASFMQKLLQGINLTDPAQLLGTIAGTATALLIPPLAPLIVATMGAAIAKEFTDEAVYATTESNAKAIKAINKKAKSKTGTGNVLTDMEARLESLKAIADKALRNSGKSYNSSSSEEVENGIINHVADQEGRRDDLTQEIRRGGLTPDAIKEKRREIARINDELEKLKNIQDKIGRQQKDIDEHKQKESDKKKKEEENKTK